MPLLRGKRNRKANFRELGKGKVYRSTKKKYGAKRANAQRVAIVLNSERRSKRRSGR